MSSRPKFNRRTIHESYERQRSRFDVSYYDEMEKVDYLVSGMNGYVLHVQFLKNPNPSDRYIIISHGYRDNHMGALKYAKMYLDFGFNCIIYDLRGHGDNKAALTTFGVLECIDLSHLIKDTRKRYKDLRILGLHGESLGAATSLYTLGRRSDIDFVIEDCGFKGIREVMVESVKLKKWQLFAVNLGFRLFCHFDLQRMRPIDQMRGTRIPILFIHGEKDTFILPYHAKDLYNASRGFKQIHIIPGADHAHSILVAPDLYRSYVKDFLEKVLP